MHARILPAVLYLDLALYTVEDESGPNMLKMLHWSVISDRVITDEWPRGPTVTALVASLLSTSSHHREARSFVVALVLLD